MECLKYEEMIQEYSDNELEKGNEAVLFNHLSECPDCRDYFKSLMTISANLDIQEYPPELEEKILYSLKDRETKKITGFFKTKFIPVFSYTLAIVLLAVSIILFSMINNYKNEVAAIGNKVILQSKTIELLFNSLPSAEVTGKVENTIIIKSKKM